MLSVPRGQDYRCMSWSLSYLQFAGKGTNSFRNLQTICILMTKSPYIFSTSRIPQWKVRKNRSIVKWVCTHPDTSFSFIIKSWLKVMDWKFESKLLRIKKAVYTAFYNNWMNFLSVGFEPTSPQRTAWFGVRCIWPLCQLTILYKTKTVPNFRRMTKCQE